MVVLIFRILKKYLRHELTDLGTKLKVLRPLCDIVNLLGEERLSWSQHIARMGTQGRPTLALKATQIFRNVAWWRRQQAFNGLFQSPIFHRAKMGKIRRWESQFHKNWILDD